MDQRSLNDILDRLQRLEESAVKLRIGVVTDTTPLAIRLGSALDTAEPTPQPVVHTGVRTLAPSVGGLAPGVKVAVLQAGNELLCLGVIASA